MQVVFYMLNNTASLPLNIYPSLGSGSYTLLSLELLRQKAYPFENTIYHILASI